MTPGEIRAERARVAPAAVAPPGESAWHRRQRWWGAMLEADRRIREAGIEPNAGALAKSPAGVNEQNMNRCERQLIDGGLSPAEVDAKMLHIVLVAEAEAIRERHRRWFKPAMIWDPERAARAVDTSLAEASAKPEAKRTSAKSDRYAKPEPYVAPKPEFSEPPVVVSRDELADVAAMAAHARAALFGATADARAGPTSAPLTTDEQPQPAKAAT